ncbi:PilZ domain-containing protein [Solidesulfovibrio sp.]
MPLVEMRKCSECDKMAWHELIDCGSPAPCYWKCRECGGRRTSPRITLDPDYALHRGRIQTENHAAVVHLVDISVRGARLRLAGGDVFAVQPGLVLLFNADLQPVGPLGVFHRATVRWVNLDEFGIAFAKPLLASAADLSCAIMA